VNEGTVDRLEGKTDGSPQAGWTREEVSGNKRVPGALTMRDRRHHQHGPSSASCRLLGGAQTQFDTGSPDVTGRSRDGGRLSTW